MYMLTINIISNHINPTISMRYLKAHISLYFIVSFGQLYAEALPNLSRSLLIGRQGGTLSGKYVQVKIEQQPNTTFLSIAGETILKLRSPFDIHCIAMSESEQIVSIVVTEDIGRGFGYAFICSFMKQNSTWTPTLPILSKTVLERQNKWIERIGDISNDGRYVYVQVAEKSNSSNNFLVKRAWEWWDTETLLIVEKSDVPLSPKK